MARSDIFVVVCYDIPDTKRRNAVFRILKNYGIWRQYSIFECQITQAQYLKMYQQLEKATTSEDKIRVYFLCRSCQNNIQHKGCSDLYPKGAIVV